MHEKGNMMESMHTCMRKKGNERVKSRGIMNTRMSKTGSMRERGGIRDKEIIRSMNTYMRKK